MSTKLAGITFGVTVALTAGTASAQIYTLEVHDGDFAGRAYPDEEQRRNNNDQEGAGLEHVRCNLMKGAADGPRVMCMGTGSYTNIPGSPVQDRIQGLCTSHRVDATLGLVQTGMRYVTNNRGDEYQNAHVPVVVPIFEGTAAAVYYNYDPDNNTELYGKILGPNCEELSGQTLLLAKQNDNVLGHASNPVVVSDSATETRLGSCGIGNGNGRDDMWCIGVRATKNAAGQVSLATYFDKSVEQEEERSRPVVVETNIPDTILECAAVGDNQPPDRGTRCSLISTAVNTPNEERVIWRKYIEQREGNIYRTTPSIAPVLGADGKVTGNYLVTYVEVDLRNRTNNRTKGRTSLKTVPISITLDNLEMLATPKYNLVGAGDQAHQHSCAGFWGPNAEPTVFVMQGSVVGSVTGVGRTAMLSFDGVTKEAKLNDELVFTDSYDTGWISQYYGNNPNTPQGRNHGFCMPLDNPGYGLATGFMPTVKQFLMVANTGRKLRTTGIAQDKMAFDLILVPAVVPEAATDPNPDPEPDPDPEPEPEPEPAPDAPGTQLGGCSTGGSSDGGALVLLGLGLAFTIRRRRAA